MASPKPIDLFVIDGDGVPLTGLTLSWNRYRTSTDGITWTAATGPAFVEDGGGWYTAIADVDAGTAVHGTIDCGATAGVRYVPWQARAEDWYTDLITGTGGDQPGSAAFRTSIGGPDVVDVTTSRFSLKLTSAFFEKSGIRPFIAGDDFSMRFLLLNGAGTDTVNLTDYLLLSTIKRRNGSATLIITRRSDTNIAGAVAWEAATVYAVDAATINDTGKVYECITPGTSAGSGGPTGTDDDITDGTVHWRYIAPAAIKQIVIDDQSVNNGVSGTSGRGWFSINYGHFDRDALIDAAGTHDFDVRAVTPIDEATPIGVVETMVSGQIEIVKPQTDPAE